MIKQSGQFYEVTQPECAQRALWECLSSSVLELGSGPGFLALPDQPSLVLSGNYLSLRVCHHAQTSTANAVWERCCGCLGGWRSRMDPCGKGICSHLGHPGAAVCPSGPPEPHCKSLCPSPACPGIVRFSPGGSGREGCLCFYCWSQRSETHFHQ